MTLLQAMVTYAVCWWMVLFMVLPHGVSPEEKPGVGHVPSAPANPRLRRKFKLATLIAIIPTLILYFIASAARAEEGMYHATSGCEPLANYVPSNDLHVKDGEGVGGKTVAPANLAGGFDASAFDTVEIPLEIPTQDRLSNRNADLSHSFIEAGTLSVSQDGDARLNGKLLTGSMLSTEGCGDAK